MGHAAYDLASLLQDARVDVPEMMEIALLSRYTRARRAAEPDFDAPGFARVYATLAAQRASKSSASSPGSTGATASRNICVTCRGYGAICSARWRIRRWRRSPRWYRVNVPPLKAL